MDTAPAPEPRPRSMRLVAAALAWLPASLLLGAPAAVCVPAAAAFGPGPSVSVVVGIVLAALVQPFVGAAADRGVGGLHRRGWSIVGVVVAAIGLAGLATFLASGRPSEVVRADMAVIAAQIGAGILIAAQQPLLAEFGRASRGVGAGLRTMFELAGAAIGIVVLAAGASAPSLVAAGARLGVPSPSVAALSPSVAAPSVASLVLPAGPPAAIAILAVVLVAGGCAALAAAAVTAARGRGTGDRRRSGDAAPAHAGLTSAAELIGPGRWRGRRSFRWLLVAQVLFVTGVGAVLRILPAFMAGVRGAPDAALAGVLLLPRDVLLAPDAVRLVTPLLGVAAIVAVPAGWASDRLGRRIPLVAGGWAAMCGAAALATATDPTGTAVGALLIAVGFGLAMPAQLALAADLAPERALGATLALIPIAAVAGAMLSAIADPVSMLAAATDGHRLVLALAAVAFAGAGLSGLRAYRFVPAALLAEEAIARPVAASAAPDRPRRT